MKHSLQNLHFKCLLRNFFCYQCQSSSNDKWFNPNYFTSPFYLVECKKTEHSASAKEPDVNPNKLYQFKKQNKKKTKAGLN